MERSPAVSAPDTTTYVRALRAVASNDFYVRNCLWPSNPSFLLKTVGSKEGWTPSSFVSSRTTRAASRTARAEDFMDEEDLAVGGVCRSESDRDRGRVRHVGFHSASSGAEAGHRRDDGEGFELIDERMGLAARWEEYRTDFSMNLLLQAKIQL
ncbi:MAG: hypothetical protein BJ554DRAFT_6245, partial [Olpidium bornovanus]